MGFCVRRLNNKCVEMRQTMFVYLLLLKFCEIATSFTPLTHAVYSISHKHALAHFMDVTSTAEPF